MSNLSDGLRTTLLDVARLAVLSAVHSTAANDPVPDAFPQPLQVRRATFVTLRAHDELRGCCGTLEPRRALVLDVWMSARAAASEDRRFEPLRAAELEELDLEICVLTPLTRLDVANQHELLAQIQPGTDGLYLKLGARRATFLPKVWESLPERTQFLRQLKIKAGLEDRFWSSEIEWFRYGAESFGAHFSTAATCH
jgi:AmmeMemoRadiSam system protein A